jgi:hypothetical protein
LLNPAQVLSRFATVVGNDIVLDFGDGLDAEGGTNRITLQNLTDLALLESTIEIF